MRVRTGFGAFIAARARLEIQYQQALRVVQSLTDETGFARAQLAFTFEVFFEQKSGSVHEAFFELGIRIGNLFELRAFDADQLNVVQRAAR